MTGDVETTRVRAQLSQLVRLGGSRRHLVALSGRVEAVWPFGATDVDGLPRFERLFLGTENDMRGFAIRGVGPRDADIVVGGDRLVFAAAEYQYEMHPRVRLVGFFDLGNVYATDFDGLEMPTLRYDAGAEAQFLAPDLEPPLSRGLRIQPRPRLRRKPRPLLLHTRSALLNRNKVMLSTPSGRSSHFLRHHIAAQVPRR